MFSTLTAGFSANRPVAFRNSRRLVFCLAVSLFGFAGISLAAAQTAPASTNVSQLGTVKSIVGDTLTLTPDKGADVAIKVSAAARLLQVAPGSKDLKAAQTIALTDIAVGDRVLVTAKPGDGGALSAIRIILTKSTDIAAQHTAEAADWQKRGSGGIVTAVKGTVITIASGSKKIDIQTSATTTFRRYAPGSVKFEEAVPGTLAQFKSGDQLSVRGDKSADGLTIVADGIIGGSFRNLSGILTAVDATGTSVTFKDLTTKKPVTVLIGAESEVKVLPPNAARMMMAMRNGAAAGGSPAPSAGGPPAGPPQGGGDPAAGGQYRASQGGAGGPGGPGGGMGGGRSMDLSSVVARLPKATPDTLKPGAAIMIVASAGATPADPPTAITVLSGVETLLTASPDGPSMTLSPMMAMPTGDGPG